MRLLHGSTEELSLNWLTLAAICGQMVTALQALESIRQLRIEWVEPVDDVIQLARLSLFQFDIARPSCTQGVDSPTARFIVQLFVFPALLGSFLLAMIHASCYGRKISIDAAFNVGGIVVFAFFISLTLAVLDPFQCRWNPDGSSSMVSNPGILCFNSSEHIFLAVLASIGILCYPVSILSWTAYTVLKYPSRVQSGSGLVLVHRHRFLFQRFKPQCYYYGLVLLLRNGLLALVPVAFGRIPGVQLQLMAVVLLISGSLQGRLWPWRSTVANCTESGITSLLLIVLLGVAPLLLMDTSPAALGLILAFAIVSPFVAGAIALVHAFYRHVFPSSTFGIFLCHHKGGAGSLCRLIKLVVKEYSSTEVFLDSDQLEDLDLIFETIRNKTRSVVVVLTSDLLSRMWCAGEVVTAFKNKVKTLPLVCDGYVLPNEDMITHIREVWTMQQWQILAQHSIGISDVQKAYQWLSNLEFLMLSRFGPVRHLEDTVSSMLEHLKIPMKLFRPEGDAKLIKARILITGAVNDAEALATLEVFQILVRSVMQRECAVVRSAKQLLAYRPWAYYLVVLLSRGILRDPGHLAGLLYYRIL